MRTASLIRKRIQDFGANVIFSSAEFLALGSRNAVDIALCRLCKTGQILRLSPGLFVVQIRTMDLPDIIEIAQAKATRFQRKIAKLKNPTNRETDDRIFYTNGCSTSFGSIRGRIEFRHITPRKLRDTKPAVFAIGLKPASAKSSIKENEFCSTQKKPEQKTSAQGRITRELLLFNIRLAKLAINSMENCLSANEKTTNYRQRSEKPAASLRTRKGASAIKTVILRESPSGFRASRPQHSGQVFGGTAKS